MLKVWALSLSPLALLWARPASACRCKDPPTTRAAYAAARAVVIAKVLELRADPSGDGFAAILSVKQAWKTDVPAQLIVVSSTTCQYELKPEGEYLLYLTHDPKMLTGSRPGTYTTGLCLGDRTLAKAGKPRSWLRAHGQGSAIKPVP